MATNTPHTRLVLAPHFLCHLIRTQFPRSLESSKIVEVELLVRTSRNDLVSIARERDTEDVALNSLVSLLVYSQVRRGRTCAPE